MFFAFFKVCSKFFWSSDGRHEPIVSLDSSNGLEIYSHSIAPPDGHPDSPDSVLLILFLEDADNLVLNLARWLRKSISPLIEPAFRYPR